MPTITDILNSGIDMSLHVTGDKSTYYCYFSHFRFGSDFTYGFGKDVDTAISNAWANFEKLLENTDD